MKQMRQSAQTAEIVKRNVRFVQSVTISTVFFLLTIVSVQIAETANCAVQATPLNSIDAIFAYKKLQEEYNMYIIDNSKCVACQNCISYCPADAIEWDGTYVTIDQAKCLECGTCKDACPNEAIDEEQLKTTSKSYISQLFILFYYETLTCVVLCILKKVNKIGIINDFLLKNYRKNHKI